MKTAIAPIKNLARLAEAGDALLTRAPGTPGIGLIHGASGLGKTTAAAWLAARCDGIYVRALATWTPLSMLQAIARELEVEPGGRSSSAFARIAESLKLFPRALFIDEFDYIVENRRMTETLRDLHDITDSPVIVIGMDGIQGKIRATEQFYNRIARRVAFKEADREDCKSLAESLCEVTVTDDLLLKLHEASKGVTRLIVTGLAAIERKADALGIKKITLEDWGKSEFFMPLQRTERKRK